LSGEVLPIPQDFHRFHAVAISSSRGQSSSGTAVAQRSCALGACSGRVQQLAVGIAALARESQAVPNQRQTTFPVDPMFPGRWSPRAFDGAAMPETDLLTMLEAARWAPSSINLQPWRFVYGLRDTPEWARLFALVEPSNQTWVQSASALVVLVSKTMRTRSDGVEVTSRAHAFDAGAAWAMLALQARLMGYFAHAMGGITVDLVLPILGFPDNGYRPEVAIAIGHAADPAVLTDEQRLREVPNQRKPLAETVFKGMFRPE